MCLVKVSKIEVVILKISLCISLSRVCVSFRYFTRYLNETSEICVCNGKFMQKGVKGLSIVCSTAME